MEVKLPALKGKTDQPTDEQTGTQGSFTSNKRGHDRREREKERSRKREREREKGRCFYLS